MYKRNVSLLLLSIATLLPNLLISDVYGRVFLVGSNPSLTLLAFPQDILKFDKDNVFYFFTYEQKPWWSDIDDPPNKSINESANRPNNTYLATGENIVDQNGNSFKHKSRINAIQNQIGFSHSLKNSIKTRFDLRYSAWPMISEASGNVDNLSFHYKERNSFHELYISSMAAKTIRNVPVGVKIGLGGIATTKPDIESNIPGEAGRLFWGWSASQGGNVLNTATHLAHAAQQDDYSLGPLLEIDFQAGATFPRLALGTRFRFNFGNLDSYNWHDDVSSYIHDEAYKVRNFTYRLYGNYIWSEAQKYRFATLVLTRYTSLDTSQHAIGNPDVENGHTRNMKNFVLQINPNVSLYPWRSKQTYIDAAILCNYSFMHFSHKAPFWVDGGQEDAYVNSNVYVGPEYSWENCSYWNQNFFEIALDLNPVFPIFGNKEQSVAIGIMAMLWTRFKWTNKYFGESEANGSDIDFSKESVRKNFDHETWLNSMISIVYRRRAFVYRFDISQPLVYSLTPKTRIIDLKKDEVIYEKANKNMWVSQAGVKLGFFITTDIDNLKNTIHGKRPSDKAGYEK
ncbi:MAG TPA: hypothetical protein VHP36_06470 [Chitinispirillaceae bacterium]|nr:hypothetical protein [Chitinispirillaceae bacterium]